jgi:energy-coupling factor transporter ATP-binding protein EcfA2
MLKELRTLDINKIEELREEIYKAHAELKGKDVVLFLGPTGSGKSTTVHFLAGSKMEKREKYGIKHHIEPVENENNPNLLSRIKTSPLAQSETQFITSTEIDLKSIGLKKSGSICLCDTPDFEDTNGPEVNIVNSTGIVNMMKNCKSVRPVILISSKDYDYAA